MKRIFALFCATLFIHGGITRVSAQETEVRKAETTGPAASLFPLGKRYVMPDFAQPGEGVEEIKKPDSLSDQEQRVLQSATEMSADDLNDLLQVYERMGNVAMQQAIARLILTRTPDHPQALHLLGGIDGKAEIRKPDYLDDKAAEVRAGKASSDPEAVASQAHALVLEKQSAQAIKLLQALRDTTYRGQPFPFNEDLAYAFADSQRWSEAEAVFTAALESSDLNEAARLRLNQQLDIVRVEKRIAALRAKTYADPIAALRESEALLKELPDHPSAIVFRIECLQYAGKADEALALLKQLKAASERSPAFAFQRQLGYTFQQLKQWDEAKAIFEELRDNPVFAEDARADARKAADASDISKRGEEALMTAGFGEWEKAEAMIAQLEREHPGDLEVLSYRCGLLARTQRAEEALKLLEEKRSQLGSSGKPFPLQDTVADVYLAQKKFDQARVAYQVILDNPKYDWAMRRRALDAPAMIRRTELMEQGFTALRDRRLDRAKEAARKLNDEFGSDLRELKLLRAEILLAQYKDREATAQFEDLKKTTPKDTPFEAASSLATACLRTGRAQEAVEAYRDILAHHRAYTPYESMSARWELRAAIPLAQPHADTVVAYRSEREGHATRADVTYTSPWWGSWRAQAFTHGDFIQLKSRLNGIASPSAEERYEAGVRMQRRITQTFAAEATLGSSQNDVLYGARVGNFIAPGLNWAASFSGNARSTESLALEALDARENRFDLAFGGALPGPWNLDVRAGANWVRVGNKNVGRGLGGSVSLEYLVQSETEKRPEITVGYLGEYRRFNLADAGSPYARLIDTETHRHGVSVAYRRNLNEFWRLQTQAAVMYSIDESALQYNAGLSLQHYFADDFMAYIDFHYDTDARSAVDGGAWEASVGVSKAF